MEPKIGQVYYVRFNGEESEQQGYRPAVIVSNNKGNAFSGNVIVLPLTTSKRKLDMPTHIVISKCDSGLPKDSMVLCENPMCVSRVRLGEYITTLSDYYMNRVAVGYLVASSIMSFMNEDELDGVWKTSCRMNAFSR